MKDSRSTNKPVRIPIPGNEAQLKVRLNLEEGNMKEAATKKSLPIRVNFKFSN